MADSEPAFTFGRSSAKPAEKEKHVEKRSPWVNAFGRSRSPSPKPVEKPSQPAFSFNPTPVEKPSQPAFSFGRSPSPKPAENEGKKRARSPTFEQPPPKAARHGDDDDDWRFKGKSAEWVDGYKKGLARGKQSTLNKVIWGLEQDLYALQKN